MARPRIGGAGMTGAPVFRGYDQAALDAQYDNRARNPGNERYFAAWQKGNEEALRRFSSRRNVAYGPSADEVLDIFLADSTPAPVHVFIHGGYWHSRTKDDFLFVALGLVPLGAHAVVVNYALASAVDMDEIVRQNRAALEWVWRNADAFGGDRQELYISGHSAGGHLVGMAMATDWPRFGDGLPADLVTAGCAISGLYDLEPIRLSYLNADVGLDAAAAARNSPTLAPPRGPQPIIVAVGETESEEYHRQADDYLAAVAAAGGSGEKYVAAGLNHYSIVEEFMRPNSRLAQVVARQMGL